MKKKFSIINISLFIGLITIVCSCSQEMTIDESEQETKGWHSVKVKFNINCTDFDQGGGATRATTDSWQDGDVVYLLLAGKDGNKVQAYVRYDGAKGEWGEVMYEGYKSNLTCTTERVAEAYFFEGVNDIENQTLSLSSDKAVYVCSEGTYIYPENGDMTVTANMKPITGRICFKGASDTSVKVGGIKTYSSFSRTTGEFTTSTESVSTTVNSDGCTPYIYCVFADVDSPTLTITHDNTYKTVFDASSTVLKPGKSGSIMLPTKEDHRGWKMYDNTFTIGDVTFKMKYVEAGTFQMGDSFEQPIHSVTITKDYYIGETEVTQALWKAVTGYSPATDGNAWSSAYGLGDNYPAYYISYEDVQSFITKLNNMTGENFRMPTEAEWEYAARGGNKSKGYTYSGSNTIDDVAWYSDNSSKCSHPVKTKSANELGIYDMSGNVWEWCSDWYGSYSSSAQTDPTGPTTGTYRVTRGGGWDGAATGCPCTLRNSNTPSARYFYVIGFRLAL